MILSALVSIAVATTAATTSVPPDSAPADSAPADSAPADSAPAAAATPLETLNGLLATPFDSDDPLAAELVGVEPQLWLDTSDDDLTNAVAGVVIGEDQGVSYIVFSTADIAEAEFATRVAPSDGFEPVTAEPAGDGERVSIAADGASGCVERTGITMAIAFSDKTAEGAACDLLDIAIAHLDDAAASGAVPAQSDPPTGIDVLNTLLDPATVLVADAAPAEPVDYADPGVAGSVGAARTAVGSATVTVTVFADDDQRDDWLTLNGFDAAAAADNGGGGTIALESSSCAGVGDTFAVIVESDSEDNCAVAAEASSNLAVLLSSPPNG